MRSRKLRETNRHSTREFQLSEGQALFFEDKIVEKSTYAERLQAGIDEMMQSQNEIIKNYVLLKEFSQNPSSQNLKQLPQSLQQEIDGISRNILQSLRELEKNEPEVATEALKNIVADWLVENDIIYRSYQKILRTIRAAQDQVGFLRRNQESLNTITNSVGYEMRTRRDMSGPALFLRGALSPSSEASYQQKLSLLQGQRSRVQESKQSLSRMLNELRTLLKTEFQTSPQAILSLGPNLLTELNQTYRAVELLHIELEKLQNYTFLTEGKLDDLYRHISEQQRKIVDELLKAVLP